MVILSFISGIAILGFIDACKKEKEEPYEPWN
jgi:hypothetical protein